MFKERQDIFNEIEAIVGGRDENGNMPDHLMNRRRSFEIQMLAMAFIHLDDVKETVQNIRFYGAA